MYILVLESAAVGVKPFITGMGSVTVKTVEDVTKPPVAAIVICPPSVPVGTWKVNDVQYIL